MQNKSKSRTGQTGQTSSTAPAAATMETSLLAPRDWLGFVNMPLRLFLGVTFVYGGLQKLTDPQYFNPAARGYIGKQILSFAHGSPISGFLVNVAATHAPLFGAMVAYGELAIGIGTLLGLLLRPAAFFGLLINLVFFLSASWRVYPYFFGSDIVYVFCWLTLLLSGPLHSGLPTLDAVLVPRLLLRGSESEAQDTTLARICAIVLGVGANQEQEVVYEPQMPAQEKQRQQGSHNIRRRTAQQREETRRNLILGIVSGAGAILILVWMAQSLRLF